MQGVEILLLFGERMMVILQRYAPDSIICFFQKVTLLLSTLFLYSSYIFSWLHLRIIYSFPAPLIRLCEFGTSEGASSPLISLNASILLLSFGSRALQFPGLVACFLSKIRKQSQFCTNIYKEIMDSILCRRIMLPVHYIQTHNGM